ncbi:diguanylate cyclase (GGDEF)-like protein/PAS domain S-box-containing protein [Agrobacterium larrymoorei]|uniref:Diguanylate cyclase (GGDEF)-like protein/PAS domain S-box-containing protein n=1 Tax=Agrobacterium larrymoorei TaxID=160699 RepID=A0AAJ2B976_9HYPH|nr:diguanylate cyclase [Agrobacterium larrymoorei]MDR6101489.1 diguanylate cyclase (GGDEF)-like protein/PAS domain S-box-containing protein [Agrobacterium larrymoorei]
MHRGAQWLKENAQARLALFDFAFEHAPVGVVFHDVDGRIRRANQAFSRLVGIPLDMLQGMSFADFAHPDDVDRDQTLFNAVIEGARDGYSIEKRYTNRHGAIVHVVIHLTAMRDATGNIVQLLSQVQDISAQKESERQLAEKAAQLELAMEAVRGGFWHMDVAAGRFETSERLAQFIGGPAAARLDLALYLARVNPSDMAAADLTSLLSGEVDHSCAEYRLNTVFGERWMRCDRRLLRNPDGTPRRIVGVAIDFTDEHLRLKEFERRSETDALTGLLNRRGLAMRFPLLSSSAGWTVLLMDLDGFKIVNDVHGHSAGDKVLLETARRLEQHVCPGDLVCRTGGDEFVIVVAGDLIVADQVAARIVEGMREPVSIGKTTVDVRATIGGVWTPAKTSLDELLADADVLLYQAKAAGKDRWTLEAKIHPAITH